MPKTEGVKERAREVGLTELGPWAGVRTLSFSLPRGHLLPVLRAKGLAQDLVVRESSPVPARKPLLPPCPHPSSPVSAGPGRQ